MSGTISFREMMSLTAPWDNSVSLPSLLLQHFLTVTVSPFLLCLQSGQPIQIQFRTEATAEKSKLILFLMSIR